MTRPAYRPAGRPVPAWFHESQALREALATWLVAKGARLAAWGPSDWTPGFYPTVSGFATHAPLVQVRYVARTVDAVSIAALWGPTRDRAQDAAMLTALSAAHALLQAEGWTVTLVPDAPTPLRYCPHLVVEQQPK